MHNKTRYNQKPLSVPKKPFLVCTLEIPLWHGRTWTCTSTMCIRHHSPCWCCNRTSAWHLNFVFRYFSNNKSVLKSDPKEKITQHRPMNVAKPKSACLIKYLQASDCCLVSRSSPLIQFDLLEVHAGTIACLEDLYLLFFFVGQRKAERLNMSPSYLHKSKLFFCSPNAKSV